MNIKADLKLYYDSYINELVNVLLRNEYSVNLTLCNENNDRLVRLVITSNEESEDK